MVTSKKIRRMTPNERRVRAAIPSSWFTKSGPGVRHKAHEVFAGLSYQDRQVAVNAGWYPRQWVFTVPYKPSRRVPPKSACSNTAPVQEAKQPKKEGILRRALRKLGRFFGGDK